ncbi:exodeoxyribonuclease VII large subunit [Beggiatoa leptomitoformis]|uniref:Exodeoxyribonuclease 7 large subunit n=1 Tax=Beggiatoa leptomitoformis TaxID=288004 RepID=A0A2N9YBJ7_9GAMM|nr:exodeoxyribonuclease VII large subunit [Beggiatoa leptomitoformis]ALG66804.1 exodeoxyribonuclease VII large subunit [Beggiatoa leptomitoformis]AUI67848.1 exodeoxyribonuclease VII large subunit [Beggiatoa leptomitoformis]
MRCEQPIYLNCPFSEKEAVKQLGARFDGDLKKWFIPVGIEIEPFRRWLPAEQVADLFAELSQNNDIVPATGVTLYELLCQLRKTIEQTHTQAYWLRAEVVAVHRRQHVYMELSDHDAEGREIAKVRASLWRERADILLTRFEQQTGLAFAAGINVLLQATVELHPVYGLSLNIIEIDPRFTVGEMAAKLQRIRAQLTQEGIFNQNKQLAHATEFSHIAVIAPPQAAGLGDFRSQADKLTALGLCTFQYYSASFQGKNAQQEIPDAIADVAKAHLKKPFDALVILRGGGATADLLQLNEYAIAKAICTAPLPVIIGIGHERDKTLLDEIANQVCHTPSLTIAQILTTMTQNAHQAQQDWQTILRESRAILNRAQLRNQQAYTQVREYALNALNRQHQQTNYLWQDVKRASQQQLQQARTITKQWMEQVLLGDPKKILQRGYVLVRDAKQTIVTQKTQAEQTTDVWLEFKDGTVHSQIVKQPKQ